MSLVVGTVLVGQYRILERLGGGGFGTTYLAEDDQHRRCVVKELNAEHLGTKEYERLRYEADILKKLDHPNLPRVYDYLEIEGQPYLVMKYIEGKDLEALADEREEMPFEWDRVEHWADGLLDALHYLHSCQPPIIHYDIKPSNICITPQGEAVLLDLGIASSLAGSHAADELGGLGTLEYAPIEQYPAHVTSEKIRAYVAQHGVAACGPGAHSDLYSLGATLAYALTLEPVTPAGYRIISGRALDLRSNAPRLPDHVVEGLEQALAIAPRERCQTAAEFRELLGLPDPQDIDRLVTGTPEPQKVRLRRGWPLFALTAVLIAILGLGAAWIGQQTWSGAWWRELATLTLTVLPTATPLSPTWTPTQTRAPTHTPTLTHTPTSTPTPSATPTAIPFAVVKEEEADVYEGPGASYPQVDQVKEGDRLTVLCCLENGEWLQVRYLGREGWIRTAAVTLQGVPLLVTPRPTPTCQAPQIVDLVLSSDTLDTMGAITITCELDPPIADGLIFAWTASGGDIRGARDRVSYQSDIAGDHTITVTIGGERCGEDERALEVHVAPAPRPVWSPELAPDNAWGRIWHGSSSIRRKIGWAVDAERVTHAAQQDFEKGIMFWIDEPGREREPSHALFADGTWKTYQGTWQEGMAEYSCPEVAPPDPSRTPRRGFGEIWCNQMGGPNAAIGWALGKERGYYPPWIRFQRGMMLLGEDGRVYVLYADQTWEVPGEGAVGLHIVDDFERYADASALNAEYKVTSPGSNSGSLRLAGSPNVASGDQGVAFDYEIGGRDPDYSGFDRTFDPPQDWCTYERLQVWVKSEGGGSELVVRFREKGGETWKQRYELGSLGARHLDIALEMDALELDYEPQTDTGLDLEQIDQFGFYVNGREGVRGTLYVDSIRLVRRGAQ
jgi:serine/threonine-protein kinase